MQRSINSATSPRFRRRKAAFAALAAGSLVVALASAASAVTSSDTQANNPQVAGDPSSDSTARFPTNKSNEPSIAVNPAPASTTLVAGANDEQGQPACGAASRHSTAPNPLTDCSFFPGVGTDGVYTSADNGASWTNRGLIDQLGGWATSPFVSDGDAVVVYGPRYSTSTHTFSTTAFTPYYQSLASYKPGQAPGNQDPEFIVVSRGSSTGSSWSAPSVITDAHGKIFNDKNAIWADKNPSSPYFGRLYASWTQFRSVPGTSEPILTSYSTDGGRTWSIPNQLSGASNNSVTGGRQGSEIKTDGHGRVYVAWEDGGSQVYAVSNNGGVSYSRPTAIGPVTDLVDPIPGSNFRNDSFLSLASDPRSDSRTLYAAWVNRTNAAGSAAELVVYKTTGGAWSKVATADTGSTSSRGVPFFQGIDVAGNGRVDLGWQALRAARTDIFGTGNATINSYYAYSTNGGSSFSDRVKVTTVSSDPAASSQNNLQRQFWGDYNTLVSKGSKAWFIYTDSRSGAGCPDVDAYQKYLSDNGLVGPGDEREADSSKTGPADGDKPAPPTDCPDQFGNTDTYVSRMVQ